MAASVCEKLPKIKEIRAFVKKSSGDQGKQMLGSSIIVPFNSLVPAGLVDEWVCDSVI